jgi:hypothetical protein
VSGNRQVIRRRKGTAVSNTYQKTSRRAQRDRQPGEIAVPEQVIVSMGDIAESAKEGLLEGLGDQGCELESSLLILGRLGAGRWGFRRLCRLAG